MDPVAQRLAEDYYLAQLCRRRAARALRADSMGEPAELLRLFEQQLERYFAEEKLSESKRAEAKHVLEMAAASGDRYADDTPGGREASMTAARAEAHMNPRYLVHLRNPGERLFLSLLQNIQLPVALRRKVELGAREFAKTGKPKIVKGYGPAASLDKLRVYQNLLDTFRGLLDVAKQAIATGKAHSEEGEGASKVKVGPFTLVNTGGFSADQMRHVADLISQAVAHAGRAGFGDVCYGNVQVTNTIGSSSRVLAFYYIEKDEMFVRANVKVTAEIVRTVLHELGHRYEHKFLRGGDRALKVLYAIIDGQETKRGFDEKPPQRGETAIYKNEEFVVVSTQWTPNGTKIHMEQKGNPRVKITSTMTGWRLLHGEPARDLKDPEHLGFVTGYAKKDPSENFAEMFSFYCMGHLPAKQVPLFERAVAGTLELQRHSSAAAYRTEPTPWTKTLMSPTTPTVADKPVDWKLLGRAGNYYVWSRPHRDGYTAYQVGHSEHVPPMGAGGYDSLETLQRRTGIDVRHLEPK